jgi:hypothetical protein
MALKNDSWLPVSMADASSEGCFLMPDSISEAQDHDEKTKARHPSMDKKASAHGAPAAGVGDGIAGTARGSRDHLLALGRGQCLRRHRRGATCAQGRRGTHAR